jgi:hypothetical protein
LDWPYGVIVKGCYMSPWDYAYVMYLGSSCRMYIDLNHRPSRLLNTTCDHLHPVVRRKMWMIILMMDCTSNKLYCKLECISLG